MRIRVHLRPFLSVYQMSVVCRSERRALMQVQRRLGLCFIILITLSSLTTNALASCPRVLPGPPCVEYWRADAVFIGVATRVVVVPNETLLSIGPYLRSTVHFTIEEAFKGVGG